MKIDKDFELYGEFLTEQFVRLFLEKEKSELSRWYIEKVKQPPKTDSNVVHKYIVYKEIEQ